MRGYVRAVADEPIGLGPAVRLLDPTSGGIEVHKRAIGEVRLGKDPLRTVAKGALVAAVSMEKKKNKAAGKGPAQKGPVGPGPTTTRLTGGKGLPDHVDVEAGV